MNNFKIVPLIKNDVQHIRETRKDDSAMKLLNKSQQVPAHAGYR